MQIAAHILAYNINRFLKPVLQNLEHHVDKIYVAHSERPLGYIQSSYETRQNPTKISDIRAASTSSKIEIIEGNWTIEEDMRNACLNRSKAEGFDWFITQDADEFYTDAAWEQIKRILLRNKSDNHFRSTWYNFWKSSEYVLVDANGSIKHTNASFAFRCASDVKFVRRRWHCNDSKVIDCPCYHYGYVMSDAEMLEKITTWGHAAEVFAKSWYHHKWKNWHVNTRYLHPLSPSHWNRAIRFPLSQPDFAEQFALPLANQHATRRATSVKERFYNFNVHLYDTKKALRRIAKGIVQKSV